MNSFRLLKIENPAFPSLFHLRRSFSNLHSPPKSSFSACVRSPFSSAALLLRSPPPRATFSSLAPHAWPFSGRSPPSCDSVSAVLSRRAPPSAPFLPQGTNRCFVRVRGEAGPPTRANLSCIGRKIRVLQQHYLLLIAMRRLTPLQLFHHLVNTTSKERSRLLGLDVGDKYVGLALSDFHNKIASPFNVLVRKKTNIRLMASDFESLISKYSLKGFVIGMPFDRHRVSSDAAQVRAFINELCKTKMLEGLHYTFWNECYTSKSVESFLKSLNLNHPVHSKTMLDKFAAVGILQGYLDYVNRKMKLAMQ